MLPKIQKIQGVFRIHWKLAILVILILFAGRAVINVYGRYQDSLANLASAEKELATMENKKTALEKTTEKLKTEQGIEEAIRQKYQVATDDEQLIVIIDAQEKKTTETAAKRTGWWQTIVEFFSGD